MTDRRALSLTVLVDQVNAIAPERNKDSDGWIGDASHQNRNSDHNPWVYDDATDTWVVTAQDITNDLSCGASCQSLVDVIVASEDPRIKYLIWNKKICSGTDQSHEAWEWRPYTGSNPHTQHAHISVKSTPEYYDDESGWGVEVTPPVQPIPSRDRILPVLQYGARGPDVEVLQGLLNNEGFEIRIDGDFGPTTDRAVRIFQYKSGLVVDGIVGPYTWNAFRH
jgi:hypothetical protein